MSPTGTTRDAAPVPIPALSIIAPVLDITRATGMTRRVGSRRRQRRHQQMQTRLLLSQFSIFPESVRIGIGRKDAVLARGHRVSGFELGGEKSHREARTKLTNAAEAKVRPV